jgi:hypothetical protein
MLIAVLPLGGLDLFEIEVCEGVLHLLCVARGSIRWGSDSDRVRTDGSEVQLSASVKVGRCREAPTFLFSGAWVAARRRHTLMMLIPRNHESARFH